MSLLMHKYNEPTPLVRAPYDLWRFGNYQRCCPKDDPDLVNAYNQRREQMKACNEAMIKSWAEAIDAKTKPILHYPPINAMKEGRQQLIDKQEHLVQSDDYKKVLDRAGALTRNASKEYRRLLSGYILSETVAERDHQMRLGYQAIGPLNLEYENMMDRKIKYDQEMYENRKKAVRKQLEDKYFKIQPYNAKCLEEYEAFAKAEREDERLWQLENSEIQKVKHLEQISQRKAAKIKKQIDFVDGLNYWKAVNKSIHTYEAEMRQKECLTNGLYQSWLDTKRLEYAKTVQNRLNAKNYNRNACYDQGLNRFLEQEKQTAKVDTIQKESLQDHLNKHLSFELSQKQLRKANAVQTWQDNLILEKEKLEAKAQQRTFDEGWRWQMEEKACEFYADQKQLRKEKRDCERLRNSYVNKQEGEMKAKKKDEWVKDGVDTKELHKQFATEEYNLKKFAKGLIEQSAKQGKPTYAMAKATQKCVDEDIWGKYRISPKPYLPVTASGDCK